MKRNIDTKDISKMVIVKNLEGERLNFRILSGFDELKMKWGDYGFFFYMWVLSYFKCLLGKPISFCFISSLSNVYVGVPLKC